MQVVAVVATTPNHVEGTVRMRTRPAAIAAAVATTLIFSSPLAAPAAHADTGPVEIATAVGSDLVSRAPAVRLNATPNVKFVSFNADGFYVSLNHPEGDVAPGTYSFTGADPLRLSASTGSAGCFGSGSTGTLVVHEATFASDGTPTAVALDYTLDCSAINYGNLAGVVRWHSAVPFSAATTTPVKAGQQIVGTRSSHDVVVS